MCAQACAELWGWCFMLERSCLQFKASLQWKSILISPVPPRSVAAVVPGIVLFVGGMFAPGFSGKLFHL